jgi:predicted alpha/beta-hydrolase family hydrolase
MALALVMVEFQVARASIEVVAHGWMVAGFSFPYMFRVGRGKFDALGR